MKPDCDLAIVGSGFGATLLAMIARRLGLRVILLERGRHPRFAIGESASPLAGLLIEQLADRYDLPRLRPLGSFGAWQREYPDVVCGLKRGFTYFKHQEGRPYHRSATRSGELLVAASPNDELSDTHWLRSDVDHFLLREAISLGAEYLDCVNLTSVAWTPDGRPELSGQRYSQALTIGARAIVDASGSGGFLAKALGIVNRGFEGYPQTQALFSHFSGVARCEQMPEYRSALELPPYPIDDAALHHVFDGGWMWVLRFGNGVTSAGVAVTDALARDLRLSDGAAAWTRLLDRYPSIAAQFADAHPVREFTWMPHLAYRAERAAGSRWAMLPSAAAFIDPLFSTGFPLTLLGIERLARLMESGALVDRKSDVEEYSGTTLLEADRTAAFIAGCYAAFPTFDVFAAYSMFYFAAASFAETARRLESPLAPTRFLASDHPGFGPAMLSLSPALSPTVADAGRYAQLVAAAVEALNVAGLCESSKRRWYGVDPEDTVNGAAKLGLTAEQVRVAFAKMGIGDYFRL